MYGAFAELLIWATLNRNHIVLNLIQKLFEMCTAKGRGRYGVYLARIIPSNVMCSKVECEWIGMEYLRIYILVRVVSRRDYIALPAIPDKGGGLTYK